MTPGLTTEIETEKLMTEVETESGKTGEPLQRWFPEVSGRLLNLAIDTKTTR